MTHSSEDSFVLIEETPNNIMRDDEDTSVSTQCKGKEKGENNDDEDGVIIDSYPDAETPIALQQIAPIDLKKDFVHILEAKKSYPISPRGSRTTTTTTARHNVFELSDDPVSNKNYKEKHAVYWHCCHGC